MTTAQISDALTDAEILVAAIDEIRARFEAGLLDTAARTEIAADLSDLVLAMSTFAEQVAA